jgi:hypothetical protein
MEKLKKRLIFTFLVLAIALFTAPVQAQTQTQQTAYASYDESVLCEWFGGRVTSGFRDPARPYHVGVDFGINWGTPVRATWNGTVTYAGWYGDFGNTVIVENGDWQMRYAHLSQPLVSPGQAVRTGEVVGISGNTGVSTGAHLHYEVRHHGAAVHPMTAPGVASGVAENGPVGDFIELRVHSGSSLTVLWTVVQWQDPDGQWRDVDGWQGEIDEVTADGVGTKRWWVSKDDLGHGPFRWVIRERETGAQVAQTGPFSLPDGGGPAVLVSAWVRR